MTNIQEYLDNEYALDIADYRGRFATVATSDPAALARWFTAYPYLTTHDMTRIAQVCSKTIYAWRRRAGIQPRRIPCVRFTRCRRRKLAAPPNWTTDWLVEAYEAGYSTTELARATGRAVQTIRERLRRRITLRDRAEAQRSRHPCCTRRWVVEHYVELGYSQLRCAKLARVSTRTIFNWLDRFDIRVRTISEQAALNHANLAQRTN